LEIIKRKIKDKSCHEQMERQLENTAESVKRQTIEEFLEGILDITRNQQMLSSGPETIYYEFCIAWGGPGIWLRTDGILKAAWWGDYIEAKITDKKVLKKLEEIQEYLDEIYQ